MENMEQGPVTRAEFEAMKQRLSYVTVVAYLSCGIALGYPLGTLIGYLAG